MMACNAGMLDFAALQAEALGGDVALLAERLEALGFGKLRQDRALGRCVERGPPGRAFHLALDPRLLVGILDVHELDADRAAIGLAQDGLDFAQRRRLAAQHVVDEDRLVEVVVGETIGPRIELCVRAGDLQSERIEPCLQMAAHAIGADQHQCAQRGDGGGADLLVGLQHGRRRARRLGRGRTYLRLVLGMARRPGGAGRLLQYRARIVVQRTEQLGEGRIDGTRVRRPAGVLLAKECRVRAAECRSEDVNACHPPEPFVRSRKPSPRWTRVPGHRSIAPGRAGLLLAHGLFRANDSVGVSIPIS